VAHRRKVAGDRVISTVDPQARHVHKTVHHRQDGYKGHVAVEPDTGLFTQGKLTQACGEDNHEAVIGLELLDDEDGELEVLGDSAYGTGDARAALAGKGHTAVIKPGPLRPPVADGFTLDDFTVDDQANTVTCPNDITRRITPRRTVTFGAACRGCPLRERCTTSKTGRALNLHPRHTLLRQARRDWVDNAQLRHTYRQHRPMVETLHRMADRTERPLPQTAPPRNPQRRPLATPTDGRAEPASPAQPRSNLPHRCVDHRLITTAFPPPHRRSTAPRTTTFTTSDNSDPSPTLKGLTNSHMAPSTFFPATTPNPTYSAHS
jgi:hypothetical protein